MSCMRKKVLVVGDFSGVGNNLAREMRGQGIKLD